MKNIQLLFLSFTLIMAASACQDTPDVGTNIPTVKTLAVETVGSTTATIYGKVADLHATHCEILLHVSTERNFPEDKTTTRSYEYTNPGAEVSISAELTDLSPGTTYYYQCCATDGITIVKGEVKAFTTYENRFKVVTGDAMIIDGQIYMNLYGQIYGINEDTEYSYGFNLTPMTPGLHYHIFIQSEFDKAEKKATCYGSTYDYWLPNTTYQYQFYAKIEGELFEGEMKSFETKNIGVLTNDITRDPGKVTLNGRTNQENRPENYYFLVSTQEDLSESRKIEANIEYNVDSRQKLYFKCTSGEITDLIKDQMYFYTLCVINPADGKEVRGNIISFQYGG